MTTVRMPPLIAVIGPVEPELLEAFVGHYHALGVQEFLLGFHFTDQAAPAARAAVLGACADLIGPPALVATGPWHEHLHSRHRDQLRAMARPGWHLIADSDEFHTYPAPIPQVIAAAEDTGHDVVGGILLDRLHADGLVEDIGTAATAAALDQAYPLAGFLTHRLLHGDPRKIVLARSGAGLELGSHRAPGHRPDDATLVAVHHFKWRPGVVADLRGRVQHHEDGSWSESTPAIRGEAGRMLTHLTAHGGRIDITDPRLRLRPVSLEGLPDWWAGDARQVAEEVRQALSPPDGPGGRAAGRRAR